MTSCLTLLIRSMLFNCFDRWRRRSICQRCERARESEHLDCVMRAWSLMTAADDNFAAIHGKSKHVVVNGIILQHNYITLVGGPWVEVG